MHIFLKFYIFLWKNKSFLFFFMAIIPLICYLNISNNSKSTAFKVVVTDHNLADFKNIYQDFNADIKLTQNTILAKVKAETKQQADKQAKALSNAIIADISYDLLQVKMSELDNIHKSKIALIKKEETIKQQLTDRSITAEKRSLLKEEISVLNNMQTKLIEQEHKTSLEVKSDEFLTKSIKYEAVDLSSNVSFSLLLSLIIGFILGCIAGVIRKYANKSYDDESLISKAFQLKTFEGIPKLKKVTIDNKHIVSGKLRLHYLTEVSRIFKYISSTDKKVIEVVSNIRNEGNSSLVYALAEHAAHIDKKVLVVDLNLRTMDLSAKLARNIADWNIEDKNYDNVNSQILNIYKNLDFLPALKDEKSVEALKSTDNLKDLLEHLKKSYDHIFVDTTASFSVNINNIDPIVIASAVDGVVVNYLANKTSRYALTETIDKIRMVEGNLLCIVTNNRYNPKLKAELLNFCKYLEKVNKPAAEFLRVKILKSYILDEE